MAVWLLSASPALLLAPALRLASPAAPALRLASPVMQWKDQPGPRAPAGTARAVTGSVAPSAVSLQQKVETICQQLEMDPNGESLAETVDKIIQQIGLELGSDLNLMQKVDACLQALGTTAAAASPSQQGPGPWRPPPIGFGDSYEGYMFGDYGYGGMGGMRYGYGGYPIGYGFGSYWGGWGGYGGYYRYSPWSISGYPGYGYDGNGWNDGYRYAGYGGRGSWGPYAGYGGLRRGSAAERALARNAEAAAAPPEGYVAETEPVQVQVPQGVRPGERFTVETSWGGRFEVSVPPAAVAGTQLTISLPTQAAYEAYQAQQAAAPRKE